MGYEKKKNAIGWLFLMPSVVLILVLSFHPIFQAFLTSLKSGTGSNMVWAGMKNYLRLLQDPTLKMTVLNTLVYLVQIPVMLGLALFYAQLLNSSYVRRSRMVYRVLLFLPCSMASVSYSLVFRIMFASDGLINTAMINLGLWETGYNFFGNTWSARFVILLALVWRWTGYNMVFLSAAMQGIDNSIYEAAMLDGATGLKRYLKITIPLLRPTLLLLTIMTLSGTLQLFDESVNLTNGGPANTTMSVSHYIYNLAFKYSPNFGYATAISFTLFIVIAVLTAIQMKVGDKRE